MRSSTLVLLFLISVQAAVNMEGEALVHGAGRPRNKQSGPYVKRSAPAAGHHQDSHRLLRSTSPSFPTPPIETPDLLPSTDLVLSTTSPVVIPTVDPRLFKMWRYHSPRVLFSAHPPDAHLDRGRGRARRHIGQPQNRGLYSVCDSVSGWANKTKATDIKGNDVTVLPEVNINNVVKKQYFFETACRDSQSGPSSCLGVDGRRWNSYCTNTHTFVRALTSFGDQVAWRHIRINVACVCVLSRKSWRH